MNTTTINHDTYQLPGSNGELDRTHEYSERDSEISRSTPNTAVERMTRDAIEAAEAAHTIDTSDIDQRRIEHVGGNVIELAGRPTAHEFDPTSTVDMLTAGAYIIQFRADEQPIRHAA